MDRVGVTLSEEKQVVVLFVPCFNDPLSSMELRSLEVGEVEDGPVLWEISSIDADQPQPTSFVLGITPPGFEAAVAYDVELEADERGQVAVTSKELPAVGVSFTAGDLRPGRVQVAGRGQVDRSDFLRVARGSCPEE
jgi:hypothetical protein